MLMIYIGDHVSSNCKLFADDCVIYRDVNSHDNAGFLHAQHDLEHILMWCRIWALPLSCSKCKAICITNKHSVLLTTYYLNNVDLCVGGNLKYIRLIIDRKLNLIDQSIYVVHKANRVLNLLR